MATNLGPYFSPITEEKEKPINDLVGTIKQFVHVPYQPEIYFVQINFIHLLFIVLIIWFLFFF
jgi:hypothetical protein